MRSSFRRLAFLSLALAFAVCPAVAAELPIPLRKPPPVVAPARAPVARPVAPAVKPQPAPVEVIEFHGRRGERSIDVKIVKPDLAARFKRKASEAKQRWNERRDAIGDFLRRNR